MAGYGRPLRMPPGTSLGRLHYACVRGHIGAQLYPHLLPQVSSALLGVTGSGTPTCPVLALP